MHCYLQKEDRTTLGMFTLSPPLRKDSKALERADCLSRCITRGRGGLTLRRRWMTRSRLRTVKGGSYSMSCSPCGFSYTSAPQVLMTGQHPSLPYPSPAPATSSGMPPENLPGLCPLPYDGRLLGPAAAYPRLADLYPGYPEHVAYTHHPAMHLYPTALTTPYDMKDPRAAWGALPETAGYNQILAAYSPYGDRFDPVDSEARRRNATRETTSTLKAWLNEHRKNPYPTKGEKIMLAIITKMTLTQVSTWFANARRRLKKENKMTWEPRNKTGDDLDDVSGDDLDDDKDDQEPKSEDVSDSNGIDKIHEPEKKRKRSHSAEDDDAPVRESSPYRSTSDLSIDNPSIKSDECSPPKLQMTDIKSDNVASPEKPKIWSLAQTATSNSPPNLRKQTLDYQDRLRRPGFETMYPMDMPQSFHNRTRLSQDSSAESSMSSPPLWRATEPHVFNPSDSSNKYSSRTPAELDSNTDVVSVSPSSTGSPVIVPPTLEQSSRLSPSYNRLVGNRFMPCSDNVPRHSPMDYSQFYASQVNSMGTSLDIRTFHPSFLRSSPFPYHVGFTCAPPAMYHSPSITTFCKTKSDEGSTSRCES
ncbi:hypothetical protein JTE90_003963 [Oedothorax gibbosus]|uniref:Homeobox domain-containing protein n=1 Tax=Oedothorax gibbosus TaxID=931172 RepID=A0AAV6UW89_9ARAC|nr:hypothetical protein JTE90_003963 [Oedothorax gibbosus]